jgi:two-component system cell cycle response regulator DivK
VATTLPIVGDDNAIPLPKLKTITRSAVVLLVQPERDDREMYAEFLRYAGLTPVVLSDATPALSLAQHVDVIVTGLLRPGRMDGIAFIRRLKNDDCTKDIPVIVLTSSAWNTERERAVRAGCDVFLAKPCLPDDLLHEIRSVMAPAKMVTPRRKPARTSVPDEPDVRSPKRAGR